MSKREKSLPEKVKQALFGKKESPPANSFEKLRVELFTLNNDVLKDISPENNSNHRLKSLKELIDVVKTKRLQECAVEAILKNTEDLTRVQNSMETRHGILNFYNILIHGQLEQMHLMRSYLFRLIALHNIPEDLNLSLEILKTLSENGKNISYFEKEIGMFLLQRFPDVMSTGKATEFLILVTNIIKFNAAYLDDNIIHGFVSNILLCCTRTKYESDIQESLNIMDAILCYSHLPYNVLHTFICILCHTANIEKFSQCSWKQMRNLLGTNVGHTSIYILCLILQDSTNYRQPSLVRGAVFFVGMALWGPNYISSLSHSPNAVLPSFLKALESKDVNIAYEVILSLQRLVKKQCDHLKTRNSCWDLIFEIIEKVLEYPELQKRTSESVLATALHDFITVAEENCPNTSSESLYKIIAQCAEMRDEKSVIRLISHYTEEIKPYKPDFHHNLNKLLELFFKNEKRSSIQSEVLRVVKQIRSNSLFYFDDDLMDQSILQNIVHYDSIVDVQTRKLATQLLIELSESCSTSRFFDIVDVIQKNMKRLFEHLSHKTLLHGCDSNCEYFSDAVAAVDGLIGLFEKKFFTMPSNQCVEIFNVLITHIQSHYQKLFYFEEIVRIRKRIIGFFLQLRGNRSKQIGIFDKGHTEFSVYVLCDSGNTNVPTESTPSSPPPGSPSMMSQALSYLSFYKSYQVMILCLKEEKDWSILEMLLKELPILLQNKSLIINGNCSVSTLCAALCGMVTDKNYGFPESLKNAPQRLTKTDVYSQIFPSIAALTSYHNHMEPYMQRLLIRCLQSGLVYRSAKICMEGLTMCTLEMQQSMMKLLPNVLLKLSKMSATVIVAVSVLEFLSNLIRLPSLYVSFVEDQYMSIFAIALPYTNPFKFDQYTVALAHHVLSMWFLKCRIPFRKDFAKFITKGLRSNLNIPLDYKQSSSSQKEESNDCPSEADQTNAAIIALHTELMETGLDLMARFTFGMSSNVPKRSPVSEFLLENGQKSSWLIGNKIVTITTSGCGTKSFKDGLCEQCHSSCHGSEKNSKSDNGDLSLEFDAVPELAAETFSSKRKRHHSAIQRRNTTISSDIMSSANKTRDDMQLNYQRFQDVGPSMRRHTSYSPNFEEETPAASAEWNTENKPKEDANGNLCGCWCTSWAEVHIRRPTGNTSWMMKIQNHLFLPSSPPDVPLSVLTSLVLPQRKGNNDLDCISYADSECSITIESEQKEISCEGAIEIASCPKSNLPVRRTNSSPDMNTGWSNFELLELESKTNKLDDSVESEKNQPNFDRNTESSVAAEGKHSSKQNLRLDLSSNIKTESLQSAPALQTSINMISSAPIDNLFDSDIKAQQVPAGSFRDRGHTISVMSPIRPTNIETSNPSKQTETSRRSGMSPSFVFLQLFHDSCFGPASQKPLLLLKNEHNVRALNVLDHIPPYDTHKIGVVYVGPGQCEDEVAILSNIYGSTRYVAFLRGLGKLVLLTEIDPQTTYLGGLDTKEQDDGKFTIIWHDDVMQVAFHVATLMLNKESDKMRNEKKKHIANDSVVIVYNESGKDFNLTTIKGQVINACVIIKPGDFNSNVVSVKLKSKELTDTFGHTENYIVSDACLSVFVRQIALHANLASLIISRRKHSAKDAQVSNWLERLRTIKRLRAKVLQDLINKNDNSGIESSCDSVNFDDFTDYV